MTASDLLGSEKSPHPSCLSGNPTFSGKDRDGQEKNQLQTCSTSTQHDQTRPNPCDDEMISVTCHCYWLYSLPARFKYKRILIKDTCCTVELPPLRIAMPSFRVEATMRPISPGDRKKKHYTRCSHSKLLYTFISSSCWTLASMCFFLYSGFSVYIQKSNNNNKANPYGLNRTFASADGLKHHLSSPSIVQSSLLIQQLLFLHLLFLLLWNRRTRMWQVACESTHKTTGVTQMPVTYFKTFNFLPIFILFIVATLRKSRAIKQEPRGGNSAVSDIGPLFLQMMKRSTACTLPMMSA